MIRTVLVQEQTIQWNIPENSRADSGIYMEIYCKTQVVFQITRARIDVLIISDLGEKKLNL